MLTKVQRVFIKFGRVLRATFFGFVEDDCYSKASALTFYSLLSIIPVLAVLFGIAKGFGFEEILEAEINKQFVQQKQVMVKLIELAYSWLLNAEGGLIAGVGTVVLLWTVFGLLSNVESALNSIWKTKYYRPYFRKLSDYLATMIISPIFFVTLSSMNVYLHAILKQRQDNFVLDAITPLVLFLLKLSPYLLSWSLFTFIYTFMPYTKVYFRSALTAGIIAGTIFQIWQWVYIKFQVGVSSYGAIYGSFAALPLFLIWLQVSWLIVLAGAELAFESENELFIGDKPPEPISLKSAALLITYRCMEAFKGKKEPVTDRALAHELGISLYHLHSVIEILESQRIISAATQNNKNIGYQPARPLDSITFQTVCQAVENSLKIEARVQESAEMDLIEKTLEDQARSSQGNDFSLL